MTDSSAKGDAAQPVSPTPEDGTGALAPVPPVDQEPAAGPDETAEGFAARLDVDPDRDGIKG